MIAGKHWTRCNRYLTRRGEWKGPLAMWRPYVHGWLDAFRAVATRESNSNRCHSHGPNVSVCTRTRACARRQSSQHVRTCPPPSRNRYKMQQFTQRRVVRTGSDHLCCLLVTHENPAPLPSHFLENVYCYRTAKLTSTIDLVVNLNCSITLIPFDGNLADS